MNKFYYDSFFHLNEPYYWVLRNFDYFKDRLKGRIAGEAHDYGLIAQCIHNASKDKPEANYLEIGVLFGGSLVLMAWFMKEFGIKGKVVGIDPLDGYYGKGNRDPVVPLVPSKEIVFENAAKFGVENRVIVIDKPSYPFPEEARKFRYGVSFIDGDHWGDMPWKDFVNVSSVTDKYIVFDNYDKSHPAVVKAALEAYRTGWVPVHVSSISFILEKSPRLVDRFKR